MNVQSFKGNQRNTTRTGEYTGRWTYLVKAEVGLYVVCGKEDLALTRQDHQEAVQRLQEEKEVSICTRGINGNNLIYIMICRENNAQKYFLKNNENENYTKREKEKKKRGEGCY